MKLTLCKLCQFADRLASGNPVLVGLFSRMATSEFPARLDPCFLAVEIETDPGETGRAVPLEIRMIDEDGKIITSWEGVLELPPLFEPMPGHTYFAVPMPWDERFEFAVAGIYRFDVVLHDGEGEEDVLGGATLVVHGP